MNIITLNIRIMLFPIRCFTCNKVIGHKWNIYNNMKKDKCNSDQIFDKIGVHRYCCKRMFISHIELIDKILCYSDKKQ